MSSDTSIVSECFACDIVPQSTDDLVQRSIYLCSLRDHPASRVRMHDAMYFSRFYRDGKIMVFVIGYRFSGASTLRPWFCDGLTVWQAVFPVLLNVIVELILLLRCECHF